MKIYSYWNFIIFDNHEFDWEHLINEREFKLHSWNILSIAFFCHVLLFTHDYTEKYTMYVCNIGCLDQIPWSWTKNCGGWSVKWGHRNRVIDRNIWNIKRTHAKERKGSVTLLHEYTTPKTTTTQKSNLFVNWLCFHKIIHVLTLKTIYFCLKFWKTNTSE